MTPPASVCLNVDAWFAAERMRGAAEAKQTFTHLHDHDDGGGGDDHCDDGDDDDDDLKPRPPINGEELGGQYWNWISIII